MLLALNELKLGKLILDGSKEIPKSAILFLNQKKLLSHKKMGCYI